MPGQNTNDSATSQLRRKIFWLAVPAFVVLAFELIGGWRFGKDTYSERYAIHLGRLYPIVWLVLALAIVAPFFALQGLVTLFSNWKTLRVRPDWLTVLLFLLMMSLAASMFSCAWSCGGHPTWIDGYR